MLLASCWAGRPPRLAQPARRPATRAGRWSCRAALGRRRLRRAAGAVAARDHRGPDVGRFGFQARADRAAGRRDGPRVGHAGHGRERAQGACTTLRGQVGKDDLVLVVLLGHGTFDGDQAKFNLVGPDLTAGRVVGDARRAAGRGSWSSTPPSRARRSSRRWRRKGRVVITATDTGAQKYATVFPEYFAKALADAALGSRQERQDLDLGGVRRDQRLGGPSLHRARAAHHRARGAERHRGEDRACRRRPPGQQGTLARSLFLDRDSAGGERQSRGAGAHRPPARARGRGRRRSSRRSRRADPAAWSAEFERLMIELARVSREIRQRS